MAAGAGARKKGVIEFLDNDEADNIASSRIAARKRSNKKKVNVALPVVVGMLPDSFSPSFFSLVRNHLWQLAQVQEKKA